jgi:hypothetical protein
MHCREHSLEGIVPFLQARNREVTIVPVLVPYLDWEQLDRLSSELADALAAALQRRGWELGRDLALVISSDAVHYGGDFDHAPFGTDAAAYLRAVERDRSLAQSHLEGPLRAEALRKLLHTLVDPDDVRSYRLPWCGRFSVPFGLETLRKTAAQLGRPAPVGTLLRYGTSLSEAALPVSQEARLAGLGYTAPSNFHHWVGYASVGYRWPSPDQSPEAYCGRGYASSDGRFREPRQPGSLPSEVRERKRTRCSGPIVPLTLALSPREKGPER